MPLICTAPSVPPDGKRISSHLMGRAADLARPVLFCAPGTSSPLPNAGTRPSACYGRHACFASLRCSGLYAMQALSCIVPLARQAPAGAGAHITHHTSAACMHAKQVPCTHALCCGCTLPVQNPLCVATTRDVIHTATCAAAALQPALNPLHCTALGSGSEMAVMVHACRGPERLLFLLHA